MRVVMENQRKAWHLRCCKKKKKGRILVRELAKCYQDKRNRINTQEEKWDIEIYKHVSLTQTVPNKMNAQWISVK